MDRTLKGRKLGVLTKILEFNLGIYSIIFGIVNSVLFTSLWLFPRPDLKQKAIDGGSVTMIIGMLYIFNIAGSMTGLGLAAVGLFKRSGRKLVILWGMIINFAIILIYLILILMGTVYLFHTEIPGYI